MKNNDEHILDFLSEASNFYLKKSGCHVNDACIDYHLIPNLSLYQVDKTIFENQASRKGAQSNVIGTMNIEGINFVYLMMGRKDGIRFYYGISEDLTSGTHSKTSQNPTIEDISTKILLPNMKANFPNSKVTALDVNEKNEIASVLNGMCYHRILEGVPGSSNNESSSAVKRFTDIMSGDNFALLIIARPLSSDEIMTIKRSVFKLYDILFPLSEWAVQDNIVKNESKAVTRQRGQTSTKGTTESTTILAGNGTTESNTDGTSDIQINTNTNGSAQNENTASTKGMTQGINVTMGITTGDSPAQTFGISSGITATETQGVTNGITFSTTLGSNLGISQSKTLGQTYNQSNSETKGTSRSSAINQSVSQTKTEAQSVGTATISQFVNRLIKEWLMYLDDVIIPRLDSGMVNGLFLTSTILLSDEKVNLMKLEGLIKSMYGTQSGNTVPLSVQDVSPQEMSFFRNFQIPQMSLPNVSPSEVTVRAALSQYVLENGLFQLGNFLSTSELSSLANLLDQNVEDNT